MFDIGFSELLVVFVVGLLILGPERLPHAAKTAGLWVRKIRRSINSVQREINAQLDNEEMQQKIAETNKRMLQEGQAIQNTITPLAVSQTEPEPIPVATAQHTDQVDAADLTESPEAMTDTDTKAKQDTQRLIDS
ncbi:Sec-independent protein translocase protein TatB [Marinomonas posidonica]|uniref:Sec-independent protein translocase protein TatB n=1 Tax=Marinomonas posidonica TaxID=936476 RepID=UPI0037350C7B